MVPEEQDIYADHDAYHREHVKRGGYPVSHRFILVPTRRPGRRACRAAPTAPASHLLPSPAAAPSPATSIHRLFVVEDGGNAVTSPPGQGFGAPVNLAPSSNIMQLAAAAGHALAILAEAATWAPPPSQ